MSSISSLWKWPLLAGLWGGAVWGTLQLHHWEGEWTHTICGPWGCGPPLQTLAACHGFWLLLLVPVSGILSCRVSGENLGRLGLILAGLGLLGILVLTVMDLRSWWPLVAEKEQKYLVERFFFNLAVQVDFPVVELLLAGMSCYATSTLRAWKLGRMFDESVFIAESAGAAAESPAETDSVGSAR